MSLTASNIVEFLESVAAPRLAEEWDNVGLLLGNRETPIDSVMTCLTLTPEVAAEAIRRGANFVVTHHPILFRAVKRLTTDTSEGKMLLELIRANVSVYSPHTSFDNGSGGINQWLANELELKNLAPLRPIAEQLTEGSGKFGEMESPMSWSEFQDHIGRKLSLKQFQAVESNQSSVQRVGIACGAAGEFLNDAHRLGCDAFITGEVRFHTCLEAKTLGVNLVILGHYVSERPAMEMFAAQLAHHFPALTVWASEAESDPIRWVSSVN